MIVFDASTIVGAALRPQNVPWRALIHAREHDRIAVSNPVADEIRDVLARPKFHNALTVEDQIEIERLLFSDAYWFEPAERVRACRDPDDDIYLELALAAQALVLVSSDKDLLVLHPWRGCFDLATGGVPGAGIMAALQAAKPLVLSRRSCRAGAVGAAGWISPLRRNFPLCSGAKLTEQIR